MQEFICLTKAKEIYKQSKNVKLKAFMRDQLLRASSSIALNLAEGNDRTGRKDRRRFFNIALTSLREVQMICDLEDLKEIDKICNELGAMIFVLVRNLSEPDK